MGGGERQIVAAKTICGKMVLVVHTAYCGLSNAMSISHVDDDCGYNNDKDDRNNNNNNNSNSNSNSNGYARCVRV